MHTVASSRGNISASVDESINVVVHHTVVSCSPSASDYLYKSGKTGKSWHLTGKDLSVILIQCLALSLEGT